jgi:5-methylcytosine-specific restriction protein A
MPNKTPRPCTHPGCKMLNCTVHQRTPSQQRQPDLRPSAARRGYGDHWRKVRAAFLLAHPTCEDCSRIATIADHVPNRRELVRMGVPDPDVDEYLHARCKICHDRKTATLDGGGWRGRGIKSL